MFGAKGGKLFGAGVDAGHDADAVDPGERLGMVVGHAAGAKDQDADGLVVHQRNPASPSWCRRGPRSTTGSSVAPTGTFGAALGSAMRASGL